MDSRWRCRVCGHESGDKEKVCIECRKNQTTVKGFADKKQVDRKR